MKVQGPSETQKTSKAKSAGKANKVDGSFDSLLTGAAIDNKAIASAQSIAQVDALLAVQAAEDPTERATQKRMVTRADTVIEKLEDLRLGLLSGRMTIGHVINIADVVASHREKVNDPNLSAILDEIDLRAQIEIAKMSKALEN